MSYRTIKRTLGETHLERKCRILFGFFLGMLICGAFFWVDRIGEGLVKDTANQIGRDYVNVSLFYLHWFLWEMDPERQEFIQQMRDDLLTQEYGSAVLSLPDDDVWWTDLEEPQLPETEREAELLRELRAEWWEQLDELEQKEQEADWGAVGDAVLPPSGAGQGAKNFEPKYKTLPLPSEGKYCYYQPVYWTQSCRGCHGPTVGSFSASERAIAADAQPFRVVKITLPYEATQKAVTKTRAWLIATAILTIFLAMVALYMIVRYVIVKPLKHLRDVSDEVSRGNMELRADIHTNDEFEELATAFNRMLRHLTETQGELRQVNSDLDAKVDELAQLNMRLYEMNRLKSDFLANMSHELRTPLNSIIGFSEVLQGIDSLDDKQKRYALNIQKSGRMLLEMINDILDLAKLEAGKMEVRPSEFRIDLVLTAQCDMVRALTEEKNIDLNVQFPEDAPPVYQDQSKVQQIVTNLLSNAIKFTPEGGRITVTAVRNDQDQLELSVADTGVGIAEEDREIIFEKFRQSTAVSGKDGLTREYSGTGLGLSIVKELSKLLGGEILLHSELGKGSTFTVVLPWTFGARAGLASEISRKLDKLTQPDGAPKLPMPQQVE